MTPSEVVQGCSLLDLNGPCPKSLFLRLKNSKIPIWHLLSYDTRNMTPEQFIKQATPTTFNIFKWKKNMAILMQSTYFALISMFYSSGTSIVKLCMFDWYVLQYCFFKAATVRNDILESLCTYPTKPTQFSLFMSDTACFSRSSTQCYWDILETFVLFLGIFSMYAPLKPCTPSLKTYRPFRLYSAIRWI